eukprot:917698_1
MVTTRSLSRNHAMDITRPNFDPNMAKTSHKSKSSEDSSSVEEIIPLATITNINKQLDAICLEKREFEEKIAELDSEEYDLTKHLWNCLIKAIESGDLALVKSLLVSQHLSPGDYKQEGTRNSALHLAVLSQRPSIVQFLLSIPDMKVNTQSNNGGFSPLMCAVMAGDLEIIRILLKHPDIDANNKTGYTHDPRSPLIHAATVGQVEVARLLLSDPAIDIFYANWTDKRKIAMVYAILSGSTEIVQMLLERPDCDPNEIWEEHGDHAYQDNYSILVLASKMGQTECVRLLLAHPDIKVTSEHRVPIECGCDHYVCDCWEDFNYEYRDTAMKEAVERGHVEIVKLFLDFKNNERDFNEQHVAMLEDAVKGGRFEIVRAFLESEIFRSHLSGYDDVGDSLLKLAVPSGNVQLVRYIMDSEYFTSRRINLEIFTDPCSRKDLEMIRFLLNHPFMNFDRSEYDTSDGPLVDCVRAGYEEGVRLLLSHPKINISEKLIYGRTALHHAAETGNINIIRMLMSHFTGNYLDGASSIPAVVQRRRYLCTFVFLFALDKECKRASAYASQGSEAATYFKSEERTFVRWLLDCAHNTRQLPVELCAMIADFL